MRPRDEASIVTYGTDAGLKERCTFTADRRTVYTGAALKAPITARATAKTYYYRVKAKKAGAYAESDWLKGANGCAVTLPPVAVPGSTFFA